MDSLGSVGLHKEDSHFVPTKHRYARPHTYVAGYLLTGYYTLISNNCPIRVSFIRIVAYLMITTLMTKWANKSIPSVVINFSPCAFMVGGYGWQRDSCIACLVSCIAFNIDPNELGVNLHCNGMITSRYCCQVNNHIITETDRRWIV